MRVLSVPGPLLESPVVVPRAVVCRRTVPGVIAARFAARGAAGGRAPDRDRDLDVHRHRGVDGPAPGSGRRLPRRAGRSPPAHPDGVRRPRRHGARLGGRWALLRVLERAGGGPGRHRRPARDRGARVAGRCRRARSDGPPHRGASDRCRGVCRPRRPPGRPDLRGRSRRADPRLADDPRPRRGRARVAARPRRPRLPSVAFARHAAAALPGHRARPGRPLPAAAHDRGAAQQPQARGHELHRTGPRDRPGHPDARGVDAAHLDRAGRRGQDADGPPPGADAPGPVRGRRLGRRMRRPHRACVRAAIGREHHRPDRACRSVAPRFDRGPPQGQAPAPRPGRLRSGARRMRRAGRGPRPVVLDPPGRRDEPRGPGRARRGDPADRVARHAGVRDSRGPARPRRDRRLPPLRRAGARPPALVRRDRRECAGRRPAVPATRRDPARDRARRGAGADAPRRADRGPAGRPVPPADRREPRRASPGTRRSGPRSIGATTS